MSDKKISVISKEIKKLIKKLKFEQMFIKYEVRQASWNIMLRHKKTDKRLHIFHSDLLTALKKALKLLQKFASERNGKIDKVDTRINESNEYLYQLEEEIDKQDNEIIELREKLWEYEKVKLSDEDKEAYECEITDLKEKLDNLKNEYDNSTKWRLTFRELLNDDDRFWEINTRVMKLLCEKKEAKKTKETER